jgi:hypothetical protein
MAGLIPDDMEEMTLAVGAIALVWAHVELALDVLIGLTDNLPDAPPRKRHPIPLAEKCKALLKATNERPELATYRGELLQIYTLSLLLGKERHAILHGAVVSTLKGDAFTAVRLVRGVEDTLEDSETSLHRAFAIFKSCYELASHVYNMIFAIADAHFPDIACYIEGKRIDTDSFTWPAINPNYTPPTAS